MPGFEPYSEKIVALIAQINIPEFLQFFKDIRCCEPLCKIVISETNLPHVKIAYAMKGISWRRQGA